MLLSYGLFLNSFERSRELYSMILKGPLQLEIFCDYDFKIIHYNHHIFAGGFHCYFAEVFGMHSAWLCSGSAADEDKVSFNFRGKRSLGHRGRFSFKTDQALSVLGSLNPHKTNACMHAKFLIENDLGLRDHVSHFLPYYLCSALKVNEY